MGRDLVEILILLAKEGACRLGGMRISLNRLTGHLGVSRQTALRRLTELERRGLISREPGPRGQRIQLTPAGLRMLRSIYKDLRSIFRSRPQLLKFVGRVITGIGEGSYYMRQDRYREQFRRLLGFDPYPGTLDLRLDPDSMRLKEELRRALGYHVDGFTTPERTFGSVRCFSAKIEGRRAAIVLPERGDRSEIMEVIAPDNLRKALGLKDGDFVTVEVMV